jgi:ectoine hydroxylase-related dioxygenase (phytanoyl-CoA dioxygenase family)
MTKENLKEEFETKGYVKISNFVNREFVDNLVKDIDSLKDDECSKYFDNQDKIRRIEKLAFKRKYLSLLNDKIAEMLNNIFQTKMVLFKDKYNLKPPKGEGFVAHYDSIFTWYDENNNPKRGWYEYCDTFYNVLVSIDESTILNGALEVAHSNDMSLSYDELFAKTIGDSEQLKQEVEDSLEFKPVELNIGDCVIFSDKCPHRSKKNNSDKVSRRIIYYTYTKKSDGDFYDEYFKDKDKSKTKVNVSKSLSVEE